MKAQQFKWMAGMVMAAIVLAGLPLFAQVETSTGVARVSLIKGDVSTERGDSNEWIAATVNTPLVPGDTIATGAGSRAEVQLDYSNVVRLAGNSEVKIADLTDSHIQLQVARGTVDFVMFSGSQASSEVDTPNVAVQPLREGTYRIDVNSNSLTLVTARDGQAQISTPQGSTTINAGQQITVEGEQNPQYQIVDARPLDDWDYWNRERNNIINKAQSYAHVNRYYTGAQDLDAYGHWVYVPDYDWCWVPYVSAGWVPYSYGRWVWEPFFGWTWVSYDPWGWAPFHYGRWFFYAGSWCWWPGYVTAFYRPLWAPAYVSFIGFNYGYYHFSFGFAYGYRSIGWCPLGPRDEFHPWWGPGRSFTVININNYYNYYGRGGFDHGRGYGGSNLAVLATDFHVRRAIVTMPADRFGREAVPRNFRPVDAATLRQAELVRGTLPVVPTRDSLRVTNRPAIVPAFARSNANNVHFFSRRPTATPAINYSFNTQAASIRQMVENRNSRAGEMRRTVESPAANRGFQASRPARVETRSNSARQAPAPVVRETPNGRTNGNSGFERNAQANQPNWRRFGTGSPVAQSRGNAVRQGQAPVIRETPQGRANGNSGFEHNVQTSQPNWRRFGTGTPASQPRGNGVRQTPAPVVRQNPQPRQDFQPQRGQPQSNQRNWQRFSGNAPTVTREVPSRNSQPFGAGTDPSFRGQQNNGGFRRFTPQPAPQAPPRNEGRTFENSGGAPQPYNEGRGGWTRFRPQPAPQSEGGFYNGGERAQGYSQPRFEGQRPGFGSSEPRSYSRPPLELNKPIMSEPRYRSFGGYRSAPAPSYHGGSRGGPAPSYHGGGSSRGSYSAPSHNSGGGGEGGGRHRR